MIKFKDPYEAKYRFLINKRESTEIKHLNDSKAFIEYSNDMNDIDKDIEKCSPNKKRKILIAFGGLIAEMLSNKKLNPVITELFIRERKLDISLVLLCQKKIRLNSIHYFIMEIPNKQELQQTAFNHSSDIDFKSFMDLYKKCTAKPYSFFSY